MRGSVFQGKQVLVLEDEPIIAMLLDELIEAAGGQAECLSTLAAVEAALDRATPDLAILDINIHNENSYAIAERLQRLGVPLIFASGYGSKGRPATMAHVPIVTKPYGLDELELALAEALALSRRV